MRIDKISSNANNYNNSVNFKRSKCEEDFKKSSFSYLNLLNNNHNSDEAKKTNFPHRTQPIGDSKSSRRTSLTPSTSLEYLNQTKQANFRVRSNPIGLAEPKLGKDGRDSAMYGSTEQLFTSTYVSTKQELQKDQRRASCSALNSGFRFGSGLIATGKPSTWPNFFMPFGSTKSTNESKPPLKKKQSNGQRAKKKAKSATEIIGNTDASTFIQQGINEIESLTKVAKGELLKRQKSEKESSKPYLDTSFQAVDVSIQSNLVQEEIEVNFTVRRNKKSSRSRSLSRQMTLPEQNVTISLPASRRTSRNPSMDRENMPILKNVNTHDPSSNIEIFNGNYDMIVPKNRNKDKKAAATVINNDFFSETMTSSAEAKDETKTANVSHESRRDKSPMESCQTEGQAINGHEQHCRGNAEGVGDSLRGLTVALENVQLQQKEQRSKLLNGKNRKFSGSSSEQNSTSTNVTVSLPSSRRSSRATSPASSQTSTGMRSRKNSLDLYSIDVNIKVNKNNNKIKNTTETSNCHIKSDDVNINNLKLCTRCHNPDHSTNNCNEFKNLVCPRCLEWDHWEDTCPYAYTICTECSEIGHRPKVHEVSEFAQRRAVVDYLSWEKFQDWFHQSSFRSWWQLNGCIGVPLYKLYKRKKEWSKEVGALDDTQMNDETQHGRARPMRPVRRRNYNLQKDDSIEELMKSIRMPKKTQNNEESKIENDIDSGRSTPEHLKKYSGSKDINGNKEEEDEDTTEIVSKKRPRTFSDTLKLLDEDILAELNVPS